MARRVEQPGGGHWVVRTNPSAGWQDCLDSVDAQRRRTRPGQANYPRDPGAICASRLFGDRGRARRNPVASAPGNLVARLPLDLAILLTHAEQAGARVELRATKVAEGAFRGEPGRGRYVRAIDVAVRPPRAGRKMAEVLATHGFRRVDGAWTLYVPDRGVRHNPADAPTPALRALLKAHGFRATKDGWTTHLPAMDVSIRPAARANPGGHLVAPAQLRAGDTIELPDLGRMHIIQGPFRSARGIRFENEYGTSLLLAPNEGVRLLARENPRVEAGTRAAALQQRVARILDEAELVYPDTRFRATRQGGLQVMGVDLYALGASPDVLLALKRAAHADGFGFQLTDGGLLMLPPWASRPAPRPDTRAFANPARRAAPRADAPLPRAELRFLVDRFSVGTSDADVAADIRRRARAWPEARREQAVAYALAQHHANQREYGGVMRGRFNNPAPRRRRSAHGYYAVDLQAPAIYRSAAPIARRLPRFASAAAAQRYAARAGAPGAPVVNLDA